MCCSPMGEPVGHLAGGKDHPMTGTSGKRTFGELEKRKNAASEKVTGWRARYTGPDAQRHPKTFGDKMAAEAWLNAERILIDRGEWKPPRVREAEARLAEQRSITFREWAERSVANKKLRPNTRNRYTKILKNRILPELGDIPLRDLAETLRAVLATRVVGCDMSWETLAAAGVPNTVAVAPDGPLPFAGRVFDLVHCLFVMHFKIPDRMLQELRRCTAEPGYLAANCYGSGIAPYRDRMRRAGWNLAQSRPVRLAEGHIVDLWRARQ